jgi:hypothetical protein
MRKFVTCLSMTALCATMFTPAFAAVDTTYGTNAALDAACDAVLSPSDQSDFTTYALNVSSSTSSSTVDTGPEYIVGIGTPTSVTDGITGPAHINGKSPNIWAHGNVTVSYATAEVRVPTMTTVTTTTSASNCHVHKPGAGSSQVEHDSLHPAFNAPNGLQGDVPDPVVETEVTYGYRVDRVITNWIDPTQSSVGKQILICISPSTNAKGVVGEWKSMHYYNGEAGGPCSRALWDLAANGVVSPSASLPTT